MVAKSWSISPFMGAGALTLAVPHPIITRRTWLWRAETGAVIEALGFVGGPLSQAGRTYLEADMLSRFHWQHVPGEVSPPAVTGGTCVHLSRYETSEVGFDSPARRHGPPSKPSGSPREARQAVSNRARPSTRVREGDALKTIG